MGTTLGVLIEDAIQVFVGTHLVIAPRKDAEALAVHLLGTEAASHTEDEAGDRLAEKYRELVARRAAGEPLGHITGVAGLRGVEVTVGPGVFVPRVQTEALLAAALAAIEDVAAPLVVDLCTGSGAVALAMAHERPDATVHAVDFDPVALEYACRNVAGRAALGDTPVVLHNADVTAENLLAELDGKVDLLLALPPFMPDGAEVPEEYSVHHPRQSVFSGPDGLEVTRHIADAAARLLRPGGTLAIEHGHLHGETVPELLRETGCYTDVTDHRDQFDYPLYALAVRRG
ncbi:HemK/PrmC family methyltransferase [Actinomadura alba]|uniref:N5-glutamine methyltransferase family protein n=1 Tax=Actinomadura alba TaxID=406431 RepID=UPI0031D2814D